MNRPNFAKAAAAGGLSHFGNLKKESKLPVIPDRKITFNQFAYHNFEEPSENKEKIEQKQPSLGKFAMEMK